MYSGGKIGGGTASQKLNRASWVDTPLTPRPKFFDTMFRRGTSLFQFYRNAAVLNLDLRLWMTELNGFTFSGGLVIGSRFFEEALVLPMMYSSLRPGIISPRGVCSLSACPNIDAPFAFPRVFDREKLYAS
jgi:hypothetical protein